jgi:CHASE2 domain-containing sensor protein
MKKQTSHSLEICFNGPTDAKRMIPPVGEAKKWYQRKWVLTAATIVAVLVLKTLFELTPWGQYLEDRAYEALLARFVAEGSKTPPGVLIVDISSIKPQQWERNGAKGIATPRPPIQDLIEVLSEPELHAKAIGVDVDFSPDNGQLIHPDDVTFFERCYNRAKETKVPIILGVKRTALRAEEWLVEDKYQRLAAFIGVRTSSHWHDHWSDRATYWIWAGNGDPLRSMSAALARVPLDQLMRDRKRWAMEATSIIDFGPLQRILEDNIVHVHFRDPKQVQNASTPSNLTGIDKREFRAQVEDRISNRIVLIGDAPQENCDSEHDRDCFRVTGVPNSIHGVFLHACAVTTIMTNKPINQLTLLGRVAIDSGLAMFVIIAVNVSIWLRRCFRLPVGRFEELWKDLIFTLLTIVIVIIAAISLISHMKLLWTDFIIVCVVLFLQFVVDAAVQIYRTRKSGAKAD